MILLTLTRNISGFSICVATVFSVWKERGNGAKAGWEEMRLFKVCSEKILYSVIAALCKMVQSQCPGSVSDNVPPSA